MPYFVPACAFSTIGMRTITLPRKIVTTACFQSIPWSISPEASMYVGMHAAMLIHSAAIDQTDHFRCATVVGARSLFQSGEDETSSVSSTKSRSVGTATVWVFMMDGNQVSATNHTNEHEHDLFP